MPTNDFLFDAVSFLHTNVYSNKNQNKMIILYDWNYYTVLNLKITELQLKI